MHVLHDYPLTPIWFKAMVPPARSISPRSPPSWTI